MKKVMTASKKYLITIICFAVVLVACIGATIGITMAYFGDVKSNSASITLGTSIYFGTDSDNKEVTMTTGLTGAVVPSQTVDVTTSLRIRKGEGTYVTKGLLRLDTTFEDKDTSGMTCDFENGTTFEVTGITGAKFVAYSKKLYLVKSSFNATSTTSSAVFEAAELFEIEPDVYLSCVIQIVVPSTVGNASSGKTCSLSITAKVLQSTVYASAGSTSVSKTIGGFNTYFDSFTIA